jgi:hypothetical protein
MQTMKLGRLLPCLALLSTAACSRFVIENEPPVAEIQVIVNGAVFDTKDPIPFAGTPVAITLDSSRSNDDDGSIVKYLWLQTDVPPNVRYDAGVMNLNSFTGDPMPVASPQVMLGEGTYQYSLWVTDNEGVVSEPATVEFTVKTPTNYMPDPACKMNYMSDIPECVDCVCTPTAMMGCLDNYNACYLNADPMFVTLCTAVVSCAREKGCTGQACYTAGCGPQIDAAAGYMGGELADCQGDPALNPCAASAQLGACTSMGACMTACN